MKISYFFKYIPLYIILTLTACGGSGSSDEEIPSPTPAVTHALAGMAIKGPLINATVHLYFLDESQVDFKGDLVSSGVTSNQARIAGLSVKEPLADAYILEIVADENTLDLTTGKAPVITRLLSYVTKSQLEAETEIFATPLSTMAIKVAVNIDDNTLTFNERINIAVAMTKSTLGFGIESDINLFTDAPLLSNTQTSVAEQQQIIVYRGAIEALASIVDTIASTDELTTDELINQLALDLYDGVIDASTSKEGQSIGYSENVLAQFDVDPATITLANDENNRTLADIKAILIAETTATGNGDVETSAFIADETVTTYYPVALNADNDFDGLFNTDDDDDDNDGYLDADEVLNATNSLLATSIPSDNDGDFISDLADLDDDNDGVEDTLDAFSTNSAASVDIDGDGKPDSFNNNCDASCIADSGLELDLDDEDNDGVVDTLDAFITNSAASVDTDLDGKPDSFNNNCDASCNANSGLELDLDDDNDGYLDEDELANGTNPLWAASIPSDNDGDLVSDLNDLDDDNDGVEDTLDAFSTNSAASVDTDLDGKPDSFHDLCDTSCSAISGLELDLDDDNDGYLDEDELANGTNPLLATSMPSDNDGDFISDLADLDDDNDGVEDTLDAFSTNSAASVDTDLDGKPNSFHDLCDTSCIANSGLELDLDNDNDGYLDEDELANGSNPLLAASIPSDNDGDFVSDLNDLDDDNDGVEDTLDAFSTNSAASVDTDLDGNPDSFHDLCDTSCIANSGLELDLDDDNDGYLDEDELANGTNPLLATSMPSDNDGDLVSDLNDLDDDNDGVVDTVDAFITNSAASVDTDLDGKPDSFHDLCDTSCIASSGLELDLDDDNDGYADVDELANGTDPLLAGSTPSDNDGDLVSDLNDLDDDNDGHNDDVDDFPFDDSKWSLYSVSLTNRAGANVSDVSTQTLIDSDFVSMQVVDPASVVAYRYKYLLQTDEPTQGEWDAETEHPFNLGMTFYREPTNQWVYIELELGDSSVLNTVFGVTGGVLTSPPDDPITPTDYVALMGTGFDVTWSKAVGQANLNEADIVMIQAAGFKNIRLRENNIYYSETVGWENTYSHHLDWQIDMLLRHNLIPILAFSTHQVLADYLEWWGPVTEYYKHKSHRLSFNLMIEIGPGVLDDAVELNSWYETITTDIRANTTTHNIIYAPNGFSHVDGLKDELSEKEIAAAALPADDPKHVPARAAVPLVIPVQAGDYAFAEWHVWAGGPSNAFGSKDWTTGTAEEKAYIDSVVDKAVAYTAETGYPTWLGAWMSGDYLNFDLLTYPEQIGFSDYLLTRLEAEGIPSSINALPTWFMDAVGHHWHEERLPIIEILNRDGSVDISDRDGDGLSNDDEVNVYGTDPDHADTDLDNIVDGIELQYGFNPLSDIDGDPDHNDATASDFDNDGMNDAVEIHYGFDPTNAADGLEDDDFDGLTNAGELIAKVAPYKFVSRKTLKMNLRDELSDLDNDGWGAANEIAVGRNPRDRWGNPSLEIFQWRPTVEDDTGTVVKNATITIHVLDNDTDVEGDTLSVVEITKKSLYLDTEGLSSEGGVVILNGDNSITYTPATDFVGDDTFEYIVTDGKGYTLGSVTITVTD